jgi:hypothetical protein
MIVRYLNRNNNMCFYHFDSLNNFENRAPYNLLNTRIYTPYTASWQNIKNIQQTELEHGMRVCLAASLIAQHTGTLQSSIKNVKTLST